MAAFTFCPVLYVVHSLCLHAQVPRLQPTTKLLWKRCADLPVRMRDAQAVIFRNKLFIGGASTSSVDGDYTICSYNSVADTWSTLVGPVCLSAFTVYQAQLVLAGGLLHTSHVITNQVWVLGDESETWCQPLPAMPTARWSASAITIDTHLAVIGGEDEHQQNLDIVEVYDGKQWAATDPLPIPCYYVKVAFHNDRYYLVGGLGQGHSVFSTSPQAIVSQSPRSEPVWKTQWDAPLSYSGVVVFESELLPAPTPPVIRT